ncbi:hypothetical protein NQT65_19150 [Pseudoalteromonas agarivorans]|uniref:hypothetical protein n=1 Tax=Pseudoalteromonas agarivorans TaxID=176102 RepID=UPI002118F8AC|nr:hypothetical protein [Pseudoalteromonas agarivorans]MCQ8822312.1 hypothetical protein [Pseudoalteromonas agarivorans]
MFTSALKFSGKIFLESVDEVFFDNTENKKTNSQLDQLNDGFGNIIADNNDMNWQEAETAQSLGEMYDTYY